MALDVSREVYCLLGLPFDAVTMADAVGRMRNSAEKRVACFVSTPNVNWVIACRADGRFRASVINSDMCVADGMPLIWIARLLGVPIHARVAGADLFERLGRQEGARLSVFFFGGEDGAAEAACRRLSDQRSGLVCAGFAQPGFGSVEDMSGQAIIDKVNASGADFVVVALGARKGQDWIERNRMRLSAPLICHLGAVVNFVAGTVTRAPSWMQRLGLEWLWRIIAEPKLWRRYFADGAALCALLVTRVLPYVWYLKRKRPDDGALRMARAEARDEGTVMVVRLQGAWARQNLGPLRDCLARLAPGSKDVRLEMDAVTYVDSALVGLLILLHGHLAATGCRLQIGPASAAVRRVARYCCAEYLFAAGGLPARRQS